MEQATRLRERWTEDDLDALPAGEHDYFERKSGALLESEKGRFLYAVAKALSAFANSGGGHLIIGVRDKGGADGVPPQQGRTSTREWLEQTVPGLLAYPLTGFRVHEVEPSTHSSIPIGRVIVVIDVPDSPAAPHQSARDKVYYHRAGGHSRPADHFYLELLRQRALSPVLVAAVTGFRVEDAYCHDDTDGNVFVECKVDFKITNVGQVAAYKWTLHITEANSPNADVDVLGDIRLFPKKKRGSYTMGVEDMTILPSLSFTRILDIGIPLSCDGSRDKDVSREVHARIVALVLGGRLIGETSVGKFQEFRLSHVIDADQVAAVVWNFLRRQI